MQHSPVGASSAYRWMACPASVKLAAACPPPESSIYAKEGTLAHEFAELQLKSMLSLEGLIKEDPKKSSEDLINFLEENEIPDEMKEGVAVYCDRVMDTLKGEFSDNFIVGVEERFNLEWIHPKMFGTNDAYVFDKKARRLTIFDLKYGKGLKVEVRYNSQLMIYALGAMETLVEQGYLNLETIELCIVQPRCEHPDGPIRSSEIRYSALINWANNILKPSVYETEKDSAAFASGKHCRFCPALAVCPKQREDAYQMAKADFSDFAETKKPKLPRPEDLTANDIEKVMEASEMFSKWADEVKKYAYYMVERGKLKLPNHKLVQKRTVRKWRDNEAASYSLNELIGAKAYKTSLISPAQAEKELTRRDIPKEESKKMVTLLTKKDEGGLTLVHNSDKRQEVSPIGAYDDFIGFMDIMQ